MSACFGIYHTNGAQVARNSLASMNEAMAYWGSDGGELHFEGPVGLGSRLRRITPEDQHESQPRAEGPLVLVAHVRLDNRSDLCRQLGLQDRPDMPDSALILAAYQSFGENCVQHLLGDWVFALWDRAQGRLLLARDASGNTGLYWWQQSDTLVFSTGMKGVLAYPAIDHQPNRNFIAGLLTMFTDPTEEDSTAYIGVRRLKPGHLLIASRHGIQLHRWWHPEELAPLVLPKLDDYYAAFLELYDDAVAQRLRVHGGTVAATLSAGLDSGSVVALAAPRLAQRGQRLKAYVHTPLYAPSGADAKRTGDEFPLAQKTAAHVGNVDAVPLRSENVSVLQGVERSLWIHDAPGHAAANEYWIIDLLETARTSGAKVLLTGQGGNATVSYAGHGSLLPELFAGSMFKVLSALRNEQSGLWRAMKHRLLKPAVQPVRTRWQRIWHASGDTPWASYSAIHPDFARELGLLERMQQAGFDPSFAAPQQDPVVQKAFRLGTVRAGNVYARWMESGAAFGLDVRDPTRDQRLVEFCWRLPDTVFWGKGLQRALVRKGMAQHLPEEVLHSPQKGLQSADIGGRLRREADEIRAVLRLLSENPLARHCLDLPRMQSILERLLAAEPRPDLVAQAQTILLRGLSMGKFLL